jgi:hypothetical protein
MPEGHCSVARLRCAANAAATADGAESNTDRVPSAVEETKLPPWLAMASAINSSWRTSESAIAPGFASQSAAASSIADRHSVTTPVGSPAAQPARRRSTSSPGVLGRRVG